MSRAALPTQIVGVAAQHHERLDRSGYPLGLRAAEIGLPAKIIAVADVVEAMARHRPYRSAVGLDKALAEISAGAGTLYNADIVNACLAVFEEEFTFEPGYGSGSVWTD